MARQERVHLDEVVQGDGVALVRIQGELRAVPLEQLPQLRLLQLPLPQQALVHHLADVRDAQVDAERRREAILELHDGRRHSGALLELLLPRGEEPGAALHALTQGRHEGLQGQHAVLVVVDVLAHLVHDDEERPPRQAPVEHLLDGQHRLVGGALAREGGAAAAVHPGHGVLVELRAQGVHHRREVIFDELAVLELSPRLAVHPGHLVHEAVVEPLELELELVLRHQLARARVAEPLLHLAHDDRVDVFVVARFAPHVEDDRDGLQAGDELLPGEAEVGGVGGVILSDQRFGQRAPVGEPPPIEGEPQELREAGLTRTIEPRDPRCRQICALLAIESAAHTP